MSVQRGVYFLANDRVRELVIVFLNSFRRSNPDIALCLIPFDDDFEDVASLRFRYDFSVWQDPEPLRRCDEFSLAFHGRPQGHFRKLAAWEGAYEEFVYIDSDTAVLRNIDFVFTHLDDFGFVVATSHVPGRAWKDSIGQAGKLTPEQFEYAANTGFVASRKGALTLSRIADSLPAARELAPHMKLGYEQPLLNYLMVTSGLPYTSLRRLRATTGDQSIPGEVYAWTPGVVARDGEVVEPASPPTLLVHWTEPVKPTQPDKRAVPLYELWQHYRNLPAPQSRTQSRIPSQMQSRIQNRRA
ncbi:hypothetical protein [Streptomyces sp. CB02923]|uniref:hypothetical protein n=1 Tax=Streptomyces sp. CB02923 TaxID=1718985 RepID=UPI00093FD003|nr:hypothetical protein [Streptomyces sp. CB02923]